MEKENAYYIVSEAVHEYHDSKLMLVQKRMIEAAWEYVRNHARNTFIGGLFIGAFAGIFIGLFIAAVYIGSIL